MTAQRLEQTFTDLAMYDRVIAVVEKALADADPRCVFRETAGIYERTYCPFVLDHDPDQFLSRYDRPDGRTIWELKSTVPHKPSAGPRMSALDLPGVIGGELPTVTYWPGEDGLPAEQYLAWWEGAVDDDARKRYESAYPKDEHGRRAAR